MTTETLTPQTDTEKLGFIQGILMAMMLDTSHSEKVRSQFEQAWKYSMEIAYSVICGSSSK